MAIIVTGDQKLRISAKLAEIQRQVFLQASYPFDPEALIRHLQMATEGKFAGKVSETSKEITKRTLQPFVTITIGNKTREELATEAHAEASEYAQDLMTKSKFIVVSKPGQVSFVSLSIAELGFTSNPRTDQFVTKEFCAKWSAENLEGQVIELCEPEDGPQLRLQYRDQPKGEVLWLAMERITASGGDPRVFYVVRDGGGRCWLRAHWTNPSDEWSLGDRVVFRLRQVA